MQEEDTIEIELLDLGDATVETRQTPIIAVWYDSFFQYGQKTG